MSISSFVWPLRGVASIALSVVLSVSAVFGISHAVYQTSTLTSPYTELRQATWKLTGDSGTCSGTFIKPKVMVTAAHCDQPNLKVGNVPVTVIKKDVILDLMLVSVDLDSPFISVVSESSLVKLDMKVVVVGYPGEMPQFITEGAVQGYVDVEGRPYMALSAPVSFGNSGGGVFAKIEGSWKLIGVVSATSGAYLGFVSIPVFHNSLATSPDSTVKFVAAEAAVR